MDTNQLPDTPWHIGFVKKDEWDPRRHKARCIYHDADGICHQGRMGCFMRKCPGSAHCKYYAETESMAEEVRLRTRSAEEERAEQMRSFLFGGQAKIQHEGQRPKTNVAQPHNETERVCTCFNGIESIPLKEIVTTNAYRQWKPDPDELDELMKFYEKYKKMDKPILVKIRDGHYTLEDNFLQYYISQKLHKKWIKSTMDRKYLNGKKK